jgi:WD40 repeat protein
MHMWMDTLWPALQVWRSPSLQKQLAPLALHRTYGQCHADVLDLDWSPDGRFLAVASKDIVARYAGHGACLLCPLGGHDIFRQTLCCLGSLRWLTRDSTTRSHWQSFLVVCFTVVPAVSPVLVAMAS